MERDWEANAAQGKNRQRQRKVVQIVVWVGIWIAFLLWFWFAMSKAATLGITILIGWGILLPLATFIISLLIGNDQGWGRIKWILPVCCGLLGCLVFFATFNLAVVIMDGCWYEGIHPGLDDVRDLVFEFGSISALGMGIGRGIRAIRTRLAKKKEN